MTAEIAILNKTGVALAADSALTLEVKSTNSKDQKIYNNSNKLFSLSKYHPVGVMVFGNASLLGIPWEIIIKSYRGQLRKTHFPNLSEYANDFISYIGKIVPVNQQENYFLENSRAYLQKFMIDLKKEYDYHFNQSPDIDRNEIIQIFSKVINTTYENVINLSDLPKVDNLNIDSILTEDRKKNLVRLIEEIFRKFSPPRADIDKLALITATIFRKDLFPSNVSGIVIAGYGDNELFPSVIPITIDGVINNTAKHIYGNYNKISFEVQSLIIPFAQREMVSTFMEGINPDYQNTIENTITGLINDIPSFLLNALGTKIIKEDKERLSRLFDESQELIKTKLHEKFDEYKEKEFISPIINAVGSLPKEELANMAETLVNLTSFKRRVSLQAETVGGPIDVALITKGDGFVWIKRKHYFTSELNHQFFNNYFNDD